MLLPFIDEDKLHAAMQSAVQRPFQHGADAAAAESPSQPPPRREARSDEATHEEGRAETTDAFGRQRRPEGDVADTAEPGDELVAQFPMDDGDTSDDERGGPGVAVRAARAAAGGGGP